MLGKLKMLVGRCVLSLINDVPKTQELQIEAWAGDVQDQVEHFQQFGFTAVPVPGAEGIVVFVGGEHDHPVVLAVEDRRHRVSGLSGGESAMYNTSGHRLVLYHDRAELTTLKYVVNASDSIQFNTPLTTFSGEVIAMGNISDLGGSPGNSMANLRVTYNGHTHKENDVKGQTNAPTQKVEA